MRARIDMEKLVDTSTVGLLAADWLFLSFDENELKTARLPSSLVKLADAFMDFGHSVVVDEVCS